MSYYTLPNNGLSKSYYQQWEPGTPGWQSAPVPGWGMNPLRAGPRRIGVGDLLPGGLADRGLPSHADIRQLAKGMRVEMEHTNDPRIAREIAQDHLVEDPRYYDKLELIEGTSGNDAVLPRYVPIGATGDDGATWGHVALAGAGGIIAGLTFGWLWFSNKPQRSR